MSVRGSRITTRIGGRTAARVVAGGGVTTVPAFTEAVKLAIAIGDAFTAPTDVAAFLLRLAQAEAIAAQSEAVGLKFPAGDFVDANAAPTEGKVFTLRAWLSGSAMSDGSDTPANADGNNNGVVATITTAALGATAVTMTSTLGANLPGGVSIASALFRAYFKSVNTLITSTGSLVLHSTSALFGDLTPFSNAALNTTVDHLSGDFTVDLIAAGIDTAAKLGSLQTLFKTVDAVAGVTPHVLTVDAACIELAGAFT